MRRRSTALGGAYSLLVFRTTHEPSFAPGTGLVDVIHGFVLLMERNDLAAIVTKNAGSPDRHLPEEFERIGYTETLSLFSGDETVYESISLRTLGAARGGLLKRAYDAANLSQVMPRAGARRSAPSNIRLRRERHVSRLAPSTGRVSLQGRRAPLEAVFEFVRMVEEELTQGRRSAFLDGFAEPLVLEDLEDSVDPRALLIHWHDVDELIEAAELTVCEPDGTTRTPTDADREQLRVDLTAALDIVPAGDRIYSVLNADGSAWGKLTRTKTKFALKCPALARYALAHPGEEPESLDRIISREQSFSIGFNNPIYAYTAGSIFCNRRLPEELGSFLSCFIPLPDLAGATSEKGNFAAAATTFADDSVFGVIEAHVNRSGAVVICDDLDDEWADHIVFRHVPVPEIEFIHSKWKDGTSTAASYFHELASQGTKNLGNLSAVAPGFDAKCNDKWCKKYRGNQVQTSIERVRSAHSIDECARVHSALRQRLDTQLTMSLAASFLSKGALEDVAAKFAAGAPVPPHISQLLWILAGFIDICRANGVRCRIYCAP